MGHTTNVDAIGQHRRDDLSGLAEPHVVGQAGAEPDPPEERQPTDTTLLVRPQLAFEPGRSGDRFDRGVQRIVEQFAQPSRCVDACHEHARRRVERLDAEAGAEQFASGARALGVVTGQQRGDLVGSQFDPLTAHTHQRPLRVGGSLQGT